MRTILSAGLVYASLASAAIVVPRAAEPGPEKQHSTTSSSAHHTTTVHSSSSSLPSSIVFTSTTPYVVSTSVPSPTSPLNATLPVQSSLAPKQAWCPSDIFCNGPLLQTINIAQLYGDSKTFVDKPTVGPSLKTLNDFYALYGNASLVNATTTTTTPLSRRAAGPPAGPAGPAGGNGNANASSWPPYNYSMVTYGALESYVEVDYQGEGLELEPATLPTQSSLPTFINPSTSTIHSPYIRGWAEIVHGYWSDLARSTNGSTLCDGVKCESTLIPLNHTFVVPGGRFREQYYWDSYWIIEGLLQSEYYSVVNSTLQNFMDELEKYGFIPNGGRIYYLNRSQPPVFGKMLFAYVNATNDLSILERALPLAEVELKWWQTNRTREVVSSYTNNTYEVAFYAVNNTAPRPEGFLEDYLTANGPDLTVQYTEAEKEALYAELASGAESGHDYTARFATNPYLGNETDQTPLLRTLNVRGTAPVDLNSILYKYRTILVDLYNLAAKNITTGSPNNYNGGEQPHFTGERRSDSEFVPRGLSAKHTSPTQGNATYYRQRASYHASVAKTLHNAIIDLFWDPTKLYFYDYNLTTHARNDWFSPAGYYAFWSGIIPEELTSDPALKKAGSAVGLSTKAQGAFAAVRMVLSRYNGTFPSSFVQTGLQWDAPNAWPPEQFIIIEALQNLPSQLRSHPLTPLSNNVTSYSLVPTGQLGLTEAQLPNQPLATGANSSQTGSTADINIVPSGAIINGTSNLLNGSTIINGGNATGPTEPWADVLVRELVNRYISSVFCAWYSTGGSIPGLLPQLGAAALNLTFSEGNTGNMFEKESLFDIDVSGSGGEYTVQAGFGWTNGVTLYLASRYGHLINTPNCPPVVVNGTSSNSTNPASLPQKREDGEKRWGLPRAVWEKAGMMF